MHWLLGDPSAYRCALRCVLDMMHLRVPFTKAFAHYFRNDFLIVCGCAGCLSVQPAHLSAANEGFLDIFSSLYLILGNRVHAPAAACQAVSAIRGAHEMMDYQIKRHERDVVTNTMNKNQPAQYESKIF